ncbi:DUF4263 domain-containing protein [Rathayibacter sp. AY1G1]|uniref:Shedu immune nuclease family protein n=1 Tax=Rathayibacter sp. AY1G1 TaxID=2080564 RepID=UPI000CE90277|nr:Shedu immune nuclease family protein [Rathayibacter sp. AY1G1]PPH10480.1 DUF4263 domain-containing protein [Rathayibacter sp. AY1G1]
MIRFEDRDTKVVLIYESDWGSVSWVDDKLRTDGEATVSRTFTVRPADLLPTENDDDGDARVFVIGAIDDEYRSIRDNVLGLKHDLRIAKSIKLTRAMFVAERDISIFRRIDELVESPIVIGGSHSSAIPEDEFLKLLGTFPTTTEMKLYAWTRITRVLSEYMETMTDAEQRLAGYMARRARSKPKTQDQPSGRIPAATKLELAKFEFVRDRLIEMLRDAEAYSEAEWQATVADLFLLIFPQYVAVLHNVNVKERYSNPGKSTNRFIDLLLVAATGTVDVIEIKKPFERGLVSRSLYRDNHVPVRELTGSIIQAEKYLFYLSKAGRDGEITITEAHSKDLPSGIEISISNPKAFILAGRDSNLSIKERFDLEFARRAYSNVTDIISYDDLLRRVENIIASLTKRAERAASRFAIEDPVTT